MGTKAVDERVVQFRIGVMVLATLLITVIMMLYFTQGAELEILQQKYKIYIDFPEAPGVTKNTPVRRSGIRIGHVTKVELKDEGGVRVTAEIEADRKIFSDEVPLLTRSLLTNDAVIDFSEARSDTPASPRDQAPAVAPHVGQPHLEQGAAVGRVAPIAEVPAAPEEIPIILTTFQMVDTQAAAPAGPAPSQPLPPKPPSRTAVPANSEIRGEISPDAMQAMSNFQVVLKGAVDRVTETSDKFGRLIDKINTVLGPEEELATQKERLKAMLDKTNATLDSFNNLANTANDVVGNPSIKQAMDDLPKVMSETRKTLTQMNNAIDLVDRNLQNLDTFTQALGDKGPSTLGRIDQAADRLDHLMCQLSSFGDALNGDKGSLGQLLHNPDLYDNLNRAAGNIKDLTVQLQPIIHDARVFSDKIARHPETLGVRGAIQPSSGAKGLPSFTSPGGFSGSPDDPSQAPPAGQPWRFGR